MMMVIFDFEKDQYMQYKQGASERIDIYQKYIMNKIKITSKRVRKEEFWNTPKIFIYNDKSVSIVTGNQEQRGGYAYIQHCKSFEYGIDRINNIIVLKQRMK